MSPDDPTFPAGIPVLDAVSATPKQGEVLVITGLSGAGRTQAAGVLEDLGWYVVDNLPPQMIAPLAGMMRPQAGGIQRLAVVVDVRSGEFFDTLMGALAGLRESGTGYRIVFLDAEDGELIRRYESVRRPHPLQGDGTILDGITKERRLLSDLRDQADEYIDTSHTSVHDLADRMTAIAQADVKPELMVVITSFGFKYGLPADANNVIDVRFLPNPYWVDELRHLTGLDSAVREYVLNKAETQTFIERLMDLLTVSLEGYRRGRNSHLSIAIGCTGGKHRSVAVAEELAGRLRALGVRARAAHRDVGRP
jgi:UPF0042 nucleotide-binding protein